MDDNDKIHDKFNPGVTEEQIRQAEKMLGGLNVPTYIEKRDLSNDFRAGILHAPNLDQGVEILISLSPVEGETRHVILSRDPLPAIERARISTRRLGEIRTRSGRVEEGHQGRRNEDKVNGYLHVSFFHPEN
jgi:hypothetical protein